MKVWIALGLLLVAMAAMAIAIIDRDPEVVTACYIVATVADVGVWKLAKAIRREGKQ